eukprot:6208196-Pleurochrysis_carterae.AAC.6
MPVDLSCICTSTQPIPQKTSASSWSEPSSVVTSSSMSPPFCFSPAWPSPSGRCRFLPSTRMATATATTATSVAGDTHGRARSMP